jgi:hypothetical protein
VTFFGPSCASSFALLGKNYLIATYRDEWQAVRTPTMAAVST